MNREKIQSKIANTGTQAFSVGINESSARAISFATMQDELLQTSVRQKILVHTD